ncbi:MAG: citramalate synthase [Treponema sp.]|jgi:2-isopropylmalate synthase|nr:citramalate synthase [Treponema sp.]
MKQAEIAQMEILDTTLRDGAQGEGITFSAQDKLAVIQALDDLGISWVEAGNPGSNPKDGEFFRLAAKLQLEYAKVCAFGATRKKGVKPADDANIQSLLGAETEAIVIFGKSWDLHVTEVLRASQEENLDMIAETVAFFKEKGRRVFYDAEHFFDGWKANPQYALSTLKAARKAGADRIVLCDTNGGTFPGEIEKAVDEAFAFLGEAETDFMGIHAHNDADMASANTITAVRRGCRHVQGTLVGFGERCGNTSLAAVMPSLELKLGFRCLPPGKMEKLSEITRAVAEISNVTLPNTMPYVGNYAFAHKAGMHADGILKIRESFEHIDPAQVGNERHFPMSEMGGRSAVAERMKKIDPEIDKDHPAVATLTQKLKDMEAQGWHFEGADGSFELLARRELGRYKPLFHVDACRVVSEHPTCASLANSHAWVKVLVDGQEEIAAAEGAGPVNALDTALRRALKAFYPELEQVRLSDYKVRVIDGGAATAAKVRVLITSTDGRQSWSTVGVSEDIIGASRAALVDSIEYKLINDVERRYKVYL